MQLYLVLHFMDTFYTTVINLRGHVLYDAVEKVKTLVIIGLRGNQLLENSKQARLKKKEPQNMSTYWSHNE